MKTGILALDLDGTLIFDGHTIAASLRGLLHELAQRGWKIVFLTGRSYALTKSIVAPLHFSYMLAQLNGEVLLKQPERQVISMNHMPLKVVKEIEMLCREKECGIVICGGFVAHDRGVYQSFGSKKYLDKIVSSISEDWKKVDSFDSLPFESIAMIRIYGEKKLLQALYPQLKSCNYFSVSLVKDKLSLKGGELLQVTDKLANKAAILRSLMQNDTNNSFVIAAGDDDNDCDMLRLANIALAPLDATQDIKKCATSIAQKNGAEGMYELLKEAIARHATFYP